MKIDEREVRCVLYFEINHQVFVYSTLLPSLRTFLTAKDREDLMPEFCPMVAALWDDRDKLLVLEVGHLHCGNRDGFFRI